MGIVLFNIEVFILLIVTVWGPSLFFQLSQLFRFLLCRFIKETFFLFQIQQSLQLSKWWHVWLLLHSEIVLLGTWWEWVNIINVNMFNPTMIINNALLQFKNSLIRPHDHFKRIMVSKRWVTQSKFNSDPTMWW